MILGGRRGREASFVKSRTWNENFLVAPIKFQLVIGTEITNKKYSTVNL